MKTTPDKELILYIMIHYFPIKPKALYEKNLSGDFPIYMRYNTIIGIIGRKSERKCNKKVGMRCV